MLLSLQILSVQISVMKMMLMLIFGVMLFTVSFSGQSTSDVDSASIAKDTVILVLLIVDMVTLKTYFQSRGSGNGRKTSWLWWCLAVGIIIAAVGVYGFQQAGMLCCGL